MSVNATSSSAASSATAVAGGAADRDVAGLLFARLTVLPALLATPWLVAGFLLLAAGWFRPVPLMILAAVFAVPALYYGLRAVPAPPGPQSYALPFPGGSMPGRRPARTPWWTVAAVLVIVVAFFADQAAYHSQFITIARDPGAYYQFAAWIAGHGSLQVPQDAAVFGGNHGGALLFGSYATYQVGDSVVLQFMAGLPMVLAGVMWAAGYHAALLVPALAGALAVLTFAGLAARLIGPRWAPLAALIVAVSLPMQFTSRSTYSEPLAEILFLGGLILVIDSLRDDTAGSGAEAGPGAEAPDAARRRARVAAALGGLILGVTILVRIDGANDVLPVIPFCGALFVRRKPQAAPLAIGLVIGAIIGVADGLVFSWPYLMQTNRSSVLPLAAITALVILMTAVGTFFYLHQPLPRWWGWLDKAALAVPFLVIVAFGLRPYVQHVRGVSNNGKPVPTYAEFALHWVNWYLGIPVILLATVGAALLTRKVLRAEARFWVLPLMVLAWVTVTFLYQPGITPDQPWASRRLVPAVLPAFVLLATWTLARISAWIRDHGYLGVPRNISIALCGLLIMAPAVVTNWGLGLSTSHGMTLRVDGLADKRTYLGELPAMERLCRMLPANSAVVFLENVDAREMEQAVRSMCGVPAAGYLHDNGRQSARASDAPGVLSVVRDVQRAGRVPVLLSYDEDQLTPYRASGTVKHVFTLYTTYDAGTLYSPPKTPRRNTVDVWMWTPSG